MGYGVAGGIIGAAYGWAGILGMVIGFAVAMLLICFAEWALGKLTDWRYARRYRR